MLAFVLSTAAFATEWQSPPQEILDVLHAPRLPWVWTSPSGQHLLLADPVTYPPLAEYAAGWYELAGSRIQPGVGAPHGRRGATGPRIVAVDGGAETALDLPEGAEIHDVNWTADGVRFALTVEHDRRWPWRRVETVQGLGPGPSPICVTPRSTADESSRTVNPAPGVLPEQRLPSWRSNRVRWRTR